MMRSVLKCFSQFTTYEIITCNCIYNLMFFTKSWNKILSSILVCILCHMPVLRHKQYFSFKFEVGFTKQAAGKTKSAKKVIGYI